MLKSGNNTMGKNSPRNTQELLLIQIPGGGPVPMILKGELNICLSLAEWHLLGAYVCS